MDATLLLDKENVKFCTNFRSRLIGMMFNKNKTNKIFCFPKCNSIHTFFMFIKIDVIMTDKDNNIIKIYQNIKPYRIILPKRKVYYTYEFNHNSIKNINKYTKIIIK